MTILRYILFCAGIFRALKPAFRSSATLKFVVSVVGELRTAAASRGFLATARHFCYNSDAIGKDKVDRFETVCK